MAAVASTSKHATMSLADVAGKGNTIRLKFVSMGDSGVGKSCLIKRFCEGRFVSKYVMTIGVDFGVKPIRLASGKQARVNFWDLSGRPEFLDVRNEFYRDSQAGILVFDVCKPETFESLETWLREAQRFGAPSAMPVAVCGNKTDKADRRRVSPEAGRAWASERGLSYFEASAQSGEGVSQVFEALLAAAGAAWAS